VSRLRAAYYMPYHDMADESDPNLWWLQANGFLHVRNAMNASMMLSDTRSATQANSIELADYVVLGVALSLLLLVAAAVMVPAVYSVLAAKQAIFAVFLSVPVDIIRALRMRLANKIVAIRRAQEEAEAGIDIAGRGDELEDDDVDAHFRLAGGDGATTGGLGSTVGGGSNIASALKKSEDDLAAAINTCRNKASSALAHAEAMAGGEDDDDDDDGGAGGSGRCCRRRGAARVAASSSDAPTTGTKGRKYAQATSARTRLLAAMLWPIGAYLM
jgi:hypothetical protein